MIDLRDANAQELTYTIFCEDCEKQFGAIVELTLNFQNKSKEEVRDRIKRYKNFTRIHDGCGEKKEKENVDSI